MGKAAQAGFNSAYDDRHILIRGPYQIAVHHHGIVGPFAHDAARCVGIFLPPFFGHGIVVHHGIHVSRRYQEAQPGPSQHFNALFILPVRLGNDSHLISACLQQPGYDGRAKGRMIHIGVAGHIHKVALLPSSDAHIIPVHG